MRTLTLGNRVYQSDGNILLADEADELSSKLAKGIEKFLDGELAKHADKPASFTMSVEYLKAIIDHIGGKSVSIWIESDKSAAFFVSGSGRFAMVMPLAPGSTGISLPEKCKAE